MSSWLMIAIAFAYAFSAIQIGIKSDFTGVNWWLAQTFGCYAWASYALMRASEITGG